MSKIAEQTITKQNLDTKKVVSLSNIDRTLELLNTLEPLEDSMERLVKIAKQFQMMLYEPELLFKYRKSWIAFLIAFRLYNSYRILKPMTIAYAKKNVDQIRLYDKELAEEIEKILPVVEKETSIFSDLFDAFAKGKEYFVSYISTNLRELITKAKSIKDEKLSKKLVALFSSISGHEVEYLVKYRNDVDNWTNYIFSYEVEFFIRRFNLYLKGGFENNTRFMGLYKDFGDVELTKTMLEDSGIKSLWVYKHQLWYINYLIKLCKKSEVSGRWEGFYGSKGFWGKEGDEEGKNFNKYAEEFSTKYGNKDFRNILMSKKSEIGENPEGWSGEWINNKLVKDGELPKLLRTLQHPTYQRQKIILPASVALHKVLKDREDELRAKRDEFVEELIRLLQETEGIGVAREKVIKKFERLLRKRKKVLLEGLNKDMVELINKTEVSLLEYDLVSNEQDKVLDKIAPYRLAAITGKLVRASNSQLAYEQKQIITGQFASNFSNFVFTNVADKLATDSLGKVAAYERFEHLSEEDFKYLRELIPRIRDIIKKLMIIYGYVKSKIEQEYIIKVEGMEMLGLDLDKRKNKNYDLIYVKKMFDRII